MLSLFHDRGYLKAAGLVAMSCFVADLLSVAQRPVTQLWKVDETKQQRCKAQHHTVRALGWEGDPLMGANAPLWSGSGSLWQHVCSHPALSKVSARTSSRPEHLWACGPFVVTAASETGPFWF